MPKQLSPTMSLQCWCVPLWLIWLITLWHKSDIVSGLWRLCPSQQQAAPQFSMVGGSSMCLNCPQELVFLEECDTLAAETTVAKASVHFLSSKEPEP